MNSGLGRKILVIPIACAGLILYFLYINWGTPSLRKNLQLFNNAEELQAAAPSIIELRNKYYSEVQNMLDPRRPFKESYDKLFLSYKKNPLFKELPQSQVLERIRGYLIGA